MRDTKRLFAIVFFPVALGAILTLPACGGSGNTSPLPTQAVTADSNGKHIGHGATPTPAPSGSPVQSSPAPSSSPVSLSTSSPAPVATATPCSSGCITPIAASDFNNSVGVNLHLEWDGNQEWDVDYSKWSSTLINSPIKYLRTGFCAYGTASSWCVNSYAPRFNQLASAGKLFDILGDPWMGWTMSTSGCNGGTGGCTSGYPANVGLNAAAINAYEGPNECNIGGGHCTQYGTSTTSYPWAPGVLNVWEPELWTLRSSSVAILGPAAGLCNYSQFPNLSAYINYSSIHDYWAPLNPEDGHTDNCISSSNTYVGTKPIISTESGYSTGPPYSEYGAESQLAQERYVGRILFMHLNPRYNIKRTYIYDLVSETGLSEGDYGLLNPPGSTNAYQPKPAWNRLMQLMSYFSDTGTSPKTPISYTLTGDTSGKLWQDLFQRSDGTYVLVPWIGQVMWDYTTDTDNTPIRENLTLTLPSSITQVTVTQFGDNGTKSVSTLNGTNGQFTVPVSSLIEAISFK